MTACPWCGKETHEDFCPWCLRSKTRVPREDAPLVFDHGWTRHLLGAAGIVSILMALGVVFWVGLKPPTPVLSSEMEAKGTAPLAMPLPTFRPSPMSDARMPPPAPRLSETARPPSVPKRSPASVEAMRASDARVSAVGGGVSIQSARLNLYDNGSEHPVLVGTVLIENRSASDVTRVDLKVAVGERLYPCEVLGPDSISHGGSAALAVRAEIPASAAKQKARSVVMNATLGNPPGGAFDTFETG